MPTISTIVPAYNSEKTILNTIESVLNQTFSDLELIVINDGSQDSTLEIVSSIQDERLKVFSYPHSGANPSRNRGFLHASGEFIAFLDADDIWKPDKLEAQLKALQENPQAAIAYSWTDYIDQSGQFLRPGGHITVNGNIYKNLLISDLLENGSNPLIRREALAAVGGFDESLCAGQDWDLYLRLAANYHFVAVPSVQVLYRVSANSISSDVFRLESGCLQVIERAFNQAPQSLQYLKPYSLANIYKYLIYKALDGSVEQRRGIAAIRFFCKAIFYDSSLLLQMPFEMILKLWLKSITVAVLPPNKAQTLLKKLSSRKIFRDLLCINNTLLQYIRVDIL